MKLLRVGEKGRERPAVLDAEGRMRDLSGVVPDLEGATLGAASLAGLRRIDPRSLPEVPAGQRIGPCIARCGKFICVGLNYREHARESGMTLPSEPVLFMKATSAIVGPNDAVIMPKDATKADWEVELGVVIGRSIANASESQALDSIAGYCVVNDLSERAFQLEGTGQWVKGKSADTFGPIGPWLVTADEAGDPQALDLWLDVNGTRMQSGSTSDMVFGAVALVSYISRFMSLHAGDIISTGTPAGVGHGMKPPVYLKAGDVMKLGIQGLGEQTQRVQAYSPPGAGS